MADESVDVRRVQSAIAASLHTHWKFFLIEGIVLMALGIAAVALPPLATVTVEIVVGWLVLVSGVLGLLMTFRTRGSPGFGWSLLSAVVGIAAGAVLLIWPLSGVISLTLVLTIFLATEGIISIMYAFAHRRESTGRWELMLVSAVVDLVLAGIILAGLPGTALWALGLIVGVNLFFGGLALTAIALQARSAAAPKTS